MKKAELSRCWRLESELLVLSRVLPFWSAAARAKEKAGASSLPLLDFAEGGGGLKQSWSTIESRRIIVAAVAIAIAEGVEEESLVCGQGF